MSDKSVFMTTIVNKNLFPSLNDETIVVYSNNKSSPSVSSFLIQEQIRQKQYLQKQKQLLEQDEHTRPINYENIKNVLLNVESKNGDQIDDWCANDLNYRKTCQKYFYDKKNHQQKSTAIRTGKDIVSARANSSLGAVGKETRRTFIKSKKNEDATRPHYTDWQMHLVNYKYKKGHYVTPADTKRLLSTKKSLSVCDFKSASADDIYLAAAAATSSSDATTNYFHTNASTCSDYSNLNGLQIYHGKYNTQLTANSTRL